MILQKLLKLSRNKKRTIIVLVDLLLLLLLLPIAVWISFSLRLGELYEPVGNIRYLFLAAPLVAIPLFVKFGLYRAIIRYVGFRAMWAVVKAVSLYTLLWCIIILLSAVPGVPRSLLLINWLVTALLIGGTRAVARWLLAGRFNFSLNDQQKKKVAMYGAGSSGMQIATALA
jgi:FlaA1/EpsC-like NDP-sugar epimerase